VGENARQVSYDGLPMAASRKVSVANNASPMAGEVYCYQIDFTIEEQQLS
jgi:hypothetical protein